MTRIAAYLAILLSATAAQAAETFDVTRGAQTERVTARLVTEGLGYSVVRHAADPVRHCHRIQVTCREGAYAVSCCPTMDHRAFCPTAQIACR